jgi:multidrug efflux pump
VSLAGAFALMYLLDYSLNNLSLMALTIASGFVVDDAIVVLENVIRHMERGESALEAAKKGTREIGFTVLSMSLSLIAVFIPILLMGGILGRLFQEFAVVLSGAILISMLVSLSTTPMMCAALLRESEHVRRPKNHALNALLSQRAVFHAQPVMNSFDQNWQSFQAWVWRMRIAWLRFWRPLRWYRLSLAWCLRYRVVMLMVLVATIALNISLYKAIPKGFFPQQDTGRIFGNIRADQSSSFQSMQERLDHFMAVVKSEPSVDNVTGFTGGGQRNSAQMFITLKPRAERDLTADQLVAKLRVKLSKEAGARLFLIPSQDIRIGARISSSQYEFTMKADELQELKEWEPKIRRSLSRLNELEDINTDYEDRGLQTSVVMDREALSRLGLTVRDVDNALSNAFSQRQVGVIYNPLNQYRVVMEWSPEYLQSASSLKDIQLLNNVGQWVPLNSVARVELTNTALSVSHEGGVPSDTFSFNLAQGVSLSQATDAVTGALADLKMPVTVRGSFSGTANAFQKSLATQPVLILAALATLYLVLGVLYESLLHPLTILSTLPSAGVGALIALMLTGTEFSVIALIGVILLIGIVKKNAILMIDFAIQYRRTGMSAAQSIYKACNLRVRPILMTTLAAMLGALPLAFGQGDGAELRHPLGVSVLGGLVLSQLLTLYTTPVVYVLLEELKSWLGRVGNWRLRAVKNDTTSRHSMGVER